MSTPLPVSSEIPDRIKPELLDLNLPREEKQERQKEGKKAQIMYTFNISRKL